jgi:S-DNA-T family DNA segregation ATPase FtsK/SpoIIIE
VGVRGRNAIADPTPVNQWRTAVDGREHELLGIALIAASVILALAMFFELGGPIGSALDTVLGWLAGLGRFLVPLALAGVGVALIKKGRTSHRVRLVLGWSLVTAGVLGLLHIVRGPDGLGSADEFGDGGGFVGSAVGEPTRGLLSEVGGSVLLVAVIVGGVVLVSGAALRDLARHAARGAGKVAVPMGRAAKRKLGELSTLSSERAAAGDDVVETTGWETLPSRPAQIYDAEADGFDPYPTSFDGEVVTDATPPLPPPRPPRIPRTPVVPAGAQAELDLGPGAAADRWKLPALSMLARSTGHSINHAEVEQRGRVLEESLASHGVDVKLVGQTVGPTVTRYELELAPGVKVARVTTLQKDIAYALAAVDVRILAPIPGRSAIGVEVPNHTRQLVALGDLLAAPEAKAASHPLDVAIGKDIAGRAVFLNLATTPHLLIAGATGAGKSSGINSIITSLLMRTTPEQVRLILVDPKQVEMGQYNRLPHLLTQPVTNPKKAANALGWAVKEMERRYDLLFEVGFRDITGYNAAFDRGDLRPEPGSDVTFERLPYIVVVVDELNDLMMVAARDVEESITRIAQKARAVGIHLIVATQRPSVNVITGVIKANIPARIAFAVSSQTDSRVILDQPGAEKLVGQGDMLLLPGNSNVAARIQGAFVSEEEIRKVVGHWRRQAPDVVYVPGIEGDEEGGMFGASGYASPDDDEDEALVRQAMDLVVRSQLGSTSMLQRKLKVGFARAGRIMDLLEQRGVVGPSEGSKARAVLMTVTELELLQEAERAKG